MPTEPMVPVVASASPMLGEAEDDEPAAMTLHRGDLVFAGKDQAPLKWHAPMEGGLGAREGSVFELRPSSGDGSGFGFRADYGPVVRVPTGPWICRQLGLRPPLQEPCTRSLSRARTRGGATVAFMAFAPEPVPVAIVRGSSVKTIRVDPISSGRLVESGATTILLLVVRSASADGRLSAGRLVPIRVEGGKLARLRSIAVDEIDARGDLKVVSRIAQFLIEGDSVHITGTRRVVQRADGVELESAPIDERYRLAELPEEP